MLLILVSHIYSHSSPCAYTCFAQWGYSCQFSNEHKYTWAFQLLPLLPRPQRSETPHRKEAEDGVYLWCWKHFSSRKAVLAALEQPPKCLRRAMPATAMKENTRSVFRRAVIICSAGHNFRTSQIKKTKPNSFTSYREYHFCFPVMAIHFIHLQTSAAIVSTKLPSTTGYSSALAWAATTAVL